MATNALKQLINQGDWGKLDYLLIDLPPGTSDIHLTMVQEVPVTGAIIVSTPQDVALADVVKGISMFKGDGINVARDLSVQAYPSLFILNSRGEPVVYYPGFLKPDQLIDKSI